jgi:hypothetical protein
MESKTKFLDQRRLVLRLKHMRQGGLGPTQGGCTTVLRSYG